MQPSFAASARNNKSLYIVDNYTFAVGGSDDALTCKIAKGDTKSLGVPARSLIIENTGSTTIYFMIDVGDNKYTDRLSLGENGSFELEPDDGVRCYTVVVWSSAISGSFSMIAMPGVDK